MTADEPKKRPIKAMGKDTALPSQKRQMTGLGSVARPAGKEFFQMASSPTVKIFVGPSRECYDVPKDLLCHYSSFFRVALTHFKEGSERVVELPEDMPEHFDVFVEFMCNGSNTRFEPKPDATPKEKLTSCFEFVLFADKYDMLNLIPEPLTIQKHIKSLPEYAPGDFSFDLIRRSIRPTLLIECLNVLPQDHPLYDYLGNGYLKMIMNASDGVDVYRTDKAFVEHVPKLGLKVVQLLCLGDGREKDPGFSRFKYATPGELAEAHEKLR